MEGEVGYTRKSYRVWLMVRKWSDSKHSWRGLPERERFCKFEERKEESAHQRNTTGLLDSVQFDLRSVIIHSSKINLQGHVNIFRTSMIF